MNIKFRLATFLAVFLLLSSVCGNASQAIDYANAENWVIREEKSNGSWDIFYIYPTLNASKDTPLLDWSDPATKKKVRPFAEAQTKGIFQSDVRIFAAYVRHLELDCRIKALKGGIPTEQMEMKHGIQDTLDAFDWYIKNGNGGRPFILPGHSQDAMDLYALLKNRKAPSPGKAFDAAYLLIGLPCITEGARKFAAAPADSRVYPVYCFNSDTAGEKRFKEFYVPDEHLDMDRFRALDVIDSVQPRSREELDDFLTELTDILARPETTKEEIVSAMEKYLLNFVYEEKGKNLDLKM